MAPANDAPTPDEAPPSAVPGRLPMNIASLLAGLALLIIFAAMAQVHDFGFQAGRTLSWIAAREGLFWLAHALVAVPGALLLAHGLEPLLLPRLRRAHRSLASLDLRAWRVMAFTFAVLLFLAARTLRSVVLLDLPVCDDENMLEFGARILATGRLCIPELQPKGAYNLIFMHMKDGCLSSWDFPGNLAFRALSILAGLGPMLYAACAAVGGVALAVAARRLRGDGAALLAGLLWCCSPMVLWLSATTHPQIVSRTLVASAFAVWAGLATRPPGEWRLRSAALLGLCTGLAGTCRPLESLALLLPIGVHVAAVGLRARRLRFLAVALLAVAVPIALLLAYNDAVTGSWFLNPRLADGAIRAVEVGEKTLPDRVPLHLGLQLLLLAVWVIGPLGLALVLLGLRGASAVPRVLAASALLMLLTTLLHGDVGIHTVGPVHFSESVVPLLLLAVLGACTGFEWLRSSGLSRAPAALALLAYLFVGLTAFDIVHGRSMRVQAVIQAVPLESPSVSEVHHAVVLAPQAAHFWLRNKSLARTGSWVYEFPLPDPSLNDDVLFVREDADLDALRARFPDRSFWRMTFPKDAGVARLERVDK